jgi:hypothetical protein
MDSAKAEDTMIPTAPNRSTRFEDRILDLVMNQFQELKTAQEVGDERIIAELRTSHELRKEQADANNRQQGYTNRMLLLLILGLLAKAGVDLAPILPFFHG